MGRRPLFSHVDQEELAQKILVAIVPVYARAHADHVASIFRDIDQLKARTKEDQDAELLKAKSLEKSLRGIGTGVVKMARYIAMEFAASGGVLETELRKPIPEEEETTEINLGNNARL